ncbi:MULTISPECIES: hypothetical protein [unclassified Microbacterium]|uniref:hypothetical protein n=1 Tax=unclassified Microbacterium TaxID=2609290 RepID=UPI003419B936
MAVDERDSVTGRPIFTDIGAPDTGVDPTEVGKYAAEVGNRIVGTTTYLENYAYRRDGLAGFDVTRGCPVIYRGTKTTGSWKREVSFRTFGLARGGMTDGTPFFQVPTEDTAKDTEPAFTYTYNGANGQLTPEAGIYLLHVKAHPGGVVTGTTFVQIRGTTTATGLLARSGSSISADPWMACTALFRADGTEGFIVDIQKQTGGQSAGSGALSMTKLATL